VCRFLLVALNTDAILEEVTVGQRRKKLKEVARGEGLSYAYTTTLARLKVQKGDRPRVGMVVLMWVLYSERPLRAEEFCHALGVEMGSEDLDLENLPYIQRVLSPCLGLVTAEASSSTVRLVHLSLPVYLLSNLTLFHNPHSTIAEVCLTYLNFRCLWDLPNPSSAPPTVPLLEYASCYWRTYMRREISENAKTFARSLLNSQATELGF